MAVSRRRALLWLAASLGVIGLAATRLRGRPSSSSASPAHPATNCRNGDCYRTYADGRRVRFQARQTWNTFNNQLEWDAGGC